MSFSRKAKGDLSGPCLTSCTFVKLVGHPATPIRPAKQPGVEGRSPYILKFQPGLLRENPASMSSGKREEHPSLPQPTHTFFKPQGQYIVSPLWYRGPGTAAGSHPRLVGRRKTVTQVNSSRPAGSQKNERDPLVSCSWVFLRRNIGQIRGD